jgi:tetratricopeptide (TPR) repeat protein
MRLLNGMIIFCSEKVKAVFFILLALMIGFLLLECALRFSGYLVHLPKITRNHFAAKERQDVRILCIGESTTDSQWPKYLEEALEQSGLSSYSFAIVDKAITSVDTARLVAELPDHMQKYEPHLVIAMVGVNDFLDVLPYSFSIFDRIKLFFSGFRVIKLCRIARSRAHFSFFKIREAMAAADSFEIKKSKILNAYENSDTSSGYYLELGELFHSYFKYDEAIALLNKGVVKHPENPELFNLLTMSYLDNGHIDVALKIVQKALKRTPDHRPLLITAGRCSYYKILQIEKSEDGSYDFASQKIEMLDKKVDDYFMRAFELDPGNMDNLQAIVWYSFSKKNNERVMNLLAAMMAAQPEGQTIYDGPLVFNLAESFIRNADFKKARDVYAGGLVVDPENPAYYRGYGLCSLLLKEKETAEMFFDKISELSHPHFFSGTVHNINLMKNIVEQYKSSFVAMQYPVRSIEHLKNIITNDDKVIYVDNGPVFRDALYDGYWHEYFFDNFGGDFGHCTPKGNRLIARNVAKTLAETYFKRET